MKLFSKIVGVAIAAILASTQLANAKTKPAPQTVKCQQCKMALSTKQTAKASTPVKVNGKTYYCCGGCAMHMQKNKAAKPAPAKATKAKPAKAAAPKTASIPLCPKCNMQMIASPTLLKKTPMVVGGKTYYCCTICPHH